MPTLSSSIIPLPKSWEEFEEITRSGLKIKWNTPNLTRIGRQGQPQDGVDIHGEDELGRSVGIQCKLTQSELEMKTITEEIAKAEEFEPKLESYYIATTTPQDAKLQKSIRLLSIKRLKEGKFPVGIFFWNDIIQDLMNNETEFSKHFPQLSLRSQVDLKQDNRMISLLDAAYFGLYIRETMGWLFGSFQTPDNVKEFKRLITDLDSIVRIVFNPPKESEIIKLLQELYNYVLPYIMGKEERPLGWDPADDFASSIEDNIRSLEYALSGRELVAFKLGQYLGAWNNQEALSDKKLNHGREKLMLQFIEIFSPGKKVPDEILELFKEYRGSDSISVVHAPHNIFNKVRLMLVLSEGIT
jgi:hypothetical protein